jgi:poly-gamma-glutamate capsule biosynthesis protein CapA/YwtB (metallophosphatase superfamily)
MHRLPSRYAFALVFVAALGLAACTGAGKSHNAPSTTAIRSPTHAAATSASRTAKPGSLTIAAVGDTMLGDTPDLPPQPGTYLAPVQHELTNGAQIVFGNLEGTLTTATANKCAAMHAAPGECYAFRDPPSYVRYLKGAGFTVLSNANPHSYDFGAAGQAETVRTIHQAGLAQTGLPGQITLVKTHGVAVAFLAFAPYTDTTNLLDLAAAQTLIKRAAGLASVVVVYMHAGAEGAAADHVTGNEEHFLGEDRGNPEAFAHMAIRAGASLVIASGPHVLRGMQFYRHHLIAYSLANFASYHNFSTAGIRDMTVILHVTLSTTGTFESARIYPVYFDAQGRPLQGGRAVSFVAQLSRADFGSSAARILPSGVIAEP